MEDSSTVAWYVVFSIMPNKYHTHFECGSHIPFSSYKRSRFLVKVEPIDDLFNRGNAVHVCFVRK